MMSISAPLFQLPSDAGRRDAPDSIWIQWADASLRFVHFPGQGVFYVRDFTDQQQAIGMIAETLLSRSKIAHEISSARAEVDLRASFQGWTLCIDHALRMDWAEVSLDPDPDEEGNCPTVGIAAQGFDAFMRKAAHRRTKDDDPIGTAIRLVRNVQSAFRSGLAIAISSERARIFARPRSPMEPLQHVAPSQWRYFRITDSERGVAETDDGLKLFDVHVQPPEVSSPPRVNTAQGVVNAARAWMKEQMLSGPPAMKRVDYEAKAMEEFAGLTKTAFNERVWPKAMEMTEGRRHSGWGKPGPKGPRKFVGI